VRAQIPAVFRRYYKTAGITPFLKKWHRTKFFAKIVCKDYGII